MDWRLQKQQGIESSFAIKSLFEFIAVDVSFSAPPCFNFSKTLRKWTKLQLKSTSKQASKASLFSSHDTKVYVAPEDDVLPHMPPYASQYR